MNAIDPHQVCPRHTNSNAPCDACDAGLPHMLGRQTVSLGRAMSPSHLHRESPVGVANRVEVKVTP